MVLNSFVNDVSEFEPSVYDNDKVVEVSCFDMRMKLCEEGAVSSVVINNMWRSNDGKGIFKL